MQSLCSYINVTCGFQQFERMSLDGYRLNKEGYYYYLYLDSHHSDRYAHHAQALNCALNRLEQASTEVSPDICSPLVNMGESARWPPHVGNRSSHAVNRSDATASKSDVCASKSEQGIPRRDSSTDVQLKLLIEKIKSLPDSKGKASDSKGLVKSSSINDEEKQLKIPEGGETSEADGSKSPVRAPFKVKKFLVSPVNEPEGGINLMPKQDEQKPKQELNTKLEQESQEGEPESSVTKVESKTSRPPSLEVTAQDTSIEVLPDDPAVVRTASTGIELGQEASPKDKFKPEDIRISVTRPSPIKEMKKLPHEYSVEEKVDTEHGLGDRRSSGSSIQVLDDETEDTIVENVVQLEPETEITHEIAQDLTTQCEEEDKHKADRELGPVPSEPCVASDRPQLSPLTVSDSSTALSRRSNLHR